MRRSVGIEVLVPSAFIKINEERQNNIYSLPLSIIEEYGCEVIKSLNRDLENGKEVYLILSAGQEKMFRNKYSEYFKFIYTADKETYVNLLVDLDTLKQEFYHYMMYYEIYLQNALNDNINYLNNLYLEYAEDTYTRKRQL